MTWLLGCVVAFCWACYSVWRWQIRVRLVALEDVQDFPPAESRLVSEGMPVGASEAKDSSQWALSCEDFTTEPQSHREAIQLPAREAALVGKGASPLSRESGRDFSVTPRLRGDEPAWPSGDRP